MRFAMPLLDEHRMLLDLVDRFVADELMPLEASVLSREARGEEAKPSGEEITAVDARVRELGLWGLNASEDMGGSDLPQTALVGANIALGRMVVPYVFPPGTPNLRMLAATASEAQRDRYLAPYVRGETVSAIAISEPGAGSDPAAMTTRAFRLPDGCWRIDGRKIWISRANVADFAILMAVTDRDAGRKQGISAFLVDRGTPGVEIVGDADGGPLARRIEHRELLDRRNAVVRTSAEHHPSACRRERIGRAAGRCDVPFRRGVFVHSLIPVS